MKVDMPLKTNKQKLWIYLFWNLFIFYICFLFFLFCFVLIIWISKQEETFFSCSLFVAAGRNPWLEIEAKKILNFLFFFFVWSNFLSPDVCLECTFLCKTVETFINSSWQTLERNLLFLLAVCLFDLRLKTKDSYDDCSWEIVIKLLQYIGIPALIYFLFPLSSFCHETCQKQYQLRVIKQEKLSGGERWNYFAPPQLIFFSLNSFSIVVWICEGVINRFKSPALSHLKIESSLQCF